jgi:hypothetical protein
MCDVVYWEAGQTFMPKTASHLFLKNFHKDDYIRYCQNEECDYKMAVNNIETVLTDASAGEAAAENL